jgi:hypothetical protein
MNQDDVLKSLVWVELNNNADRQNSNDFLKIRETLTRIGVASKKENTLYQSCHILHKQGKYAIVHFKELFALDGKQTNFTEEDRARRNTIVNLLVQWQLITISDESKQKIAAPQAPISQVKIIQHKDKNNWKLESKYSIGTRKKADPTVTD